MKYLGYLFILFLLSCSSDNSSLESTIPDQPDTRKFISKIIYESSDYGNNVFNFNYDDGNNLISITSNEDVLKYFYDNNKIIRMEKVNNTTGEIINYSNYYYNEIGLLDYFETNYLTSRVVKYIYNNNRVVEYYSYHDLIEMENNNFSVFFKAFYIDDSKNIVEYQKFNSDSELTKKSTMSFNEYEDKRYIGEAGEIINLPYVINFFESFNYYTNNNLKSWQTGFNTDELELYREYFYEYNEDGYCTNLNQVYYNTYNGEITTSFSKYFEYIELEID